eukprot:TRINITY_DN11194_c0_g1_i1.p2 TRINITY_DN11194_c0_g1~~TRINITY_DN11194_c0_g1_i1.p2  ORF type:complete len:101 (+),score=45.17 TRINITY_DN11194_c0_g1_i1:1-303(+)
MHFFFLMIRRPPRSTQSRSSAASDVYKRQVSTQSTWGIISFQRRQKKCSRGGGILRKGAIDQQKEVVLLTIHQNFKGRHRRSQANICLASIATKHYPQCL